MAVCSGVDNTQSSSSHVVYIVCCLCLDTTWIVDPVCRHRCSLMVFVPAVCRHLGLQRYPTNQSGRTCCVCHQFSCLGPCVWQRWCQPVISSGRQQERVVYGRQDLCLAAGTVVHSGRWFRGVCFLAGTPCVRGIASSLNSGKAVVRVDWLGL